MRVNRIVALIGCGMLIVLASVAWSHHYGSSDAIAALGLPGPGAAEGRRCEPTYRWSSWGRQRARAIECHGLRQLRRGEAGYRQIVTVDGLTRQVTGVHRSWSEPDSTAWQRAQDSVGVALTRRGGRPIICQPWYAGLTHIRAERAWQFPDYAVRMVAYRFQPHVGLPQDDWQWQLQMDGYVSLPTNCSVQLHNER